MKQSTYAPIFLLVAALVLIQLSGNDKAPFILALPLAASAAVLMLLLARRAGAKACVLAMVPWIYVVVAVILSRAGVLDSALTLGFR